MYRDEELHSPDQKAQIRLDEIILAIELALNESAEAIDLIAVNSEGNIVKTLNTTAKNIKVTYLAVLLVVQMLRNI